MAEEGERGKLIVLPGGGDSREELSRREVEGIIKEMREKLEEDVLPREPVAYGIVVVRANGDLGICYNAGSHDFALIAGLKHLKYRLLE